MTDYVIWDERAILQGTAEASALEAFQAETDEEAIAYAKREHADFAWVLCASDPSSLDEREVYTQYEATAC
jgi:hypothetical protein